MLTIKILGSGCANCKKLEAIVRDILAKENIPAEIVKVTDYADIMAYNVMSTPGLVVNEKLLAVGRIPAPVQIIQWLNEAQGKPSGMIPLN
ncbi:MAG: thioredoxin family protein [Anaerolineales bacterium]|nr:thioredoxin family protein [Anaerolineales bacterium]